MIDQDPWEDEFFSDAHLREEGYLEPDQPSPASHEQWRRHQLAQHGRDFTPMERWKIRLATGLVTPGGDDAE